MDKSCKTVLEHMHSKECPENYAFWLIDDAVKMEADACGLSIEEFQNTVNYLILNGYAEYVFSRNGNRSGVKLTHKGVHYKEFARAERAKVFWIPLVVSIITATITAIITSLLTLISKGLI